LGALLVVACGSRSPILELEGFDDGFGGSTSRAGSSKGGSTSRGGSSTSRGGTGAAGAPSNNGGKVNTTPNTPATLPCQQYCAGYSVTCAQELEDDNCQGLCEDELNSATPPCSALGLEAVKCLTPFFRAGSGSCEPATNRGLVQCGATLAKFKTCSGATMTAPGPRPGPGPGPGPAPGTNEPDSCPNMGTVSPVDCQVTFACASGLYDVHCSDAPEAGETYCSCYTGDVGTSFPMIRTPLASACRDAFEFCP
jgi:hypothetical protein